MEWYSNRTLTFQNNLIIAFRGILNRFDDQCHQEFHWTHLEGPLLSSPLLWLRVDIGRYRIGHSGKVDSLSWKSISCFDAYHNTVSLGGRSAIGKHTLSCIRVGLGPDGNTGCCRRTKGAFEAFLHRPSARLDPLIRCDGRKSANEKPASRNLVGRGS